MKILRSILVLVLAVHSQALFAACMRIGSTCVDGPSTKIINGVSIYKACWQYTDSYECRSSTGISDCQALQDQGCGQIGSDCVERDANRACMAYAQKYSCPDKATTTSQQTVCDTSFCNGSGCFNTTAPADKDFGQAAAMTEVVREAGIYGIDPSKIEIFKGYSEECSIKVLGGTELASCCGASGGGGAYTNHALLMTGLGAGVAVAGQAGKTGIKAGSQYMYDALFGQTDSSLIDKGLSSMNDWAGGLSGSTNFGAYGFQFAYSVDGGFAFTGFDPYSFAASIAINMIMQWLSCNPTEQTTMMKKGQNLCVYVGSYCSHKIPIIDVCTEIKQQQCCFNSILAKSVNRQGRAQLSMPANQCGGFNQAQLQALDFSRMDFSEFIASLNVDSVDPTSVKTQINSTVQTKVNSYYSQ